MESDASLRRRVKTWSAAKPWGAARRARNGYPAELQNTHSISRSAKGFWRLSLTFRVSPSSPSSRSFPASTPLARVIATRDRLCLAAVLALAVRARRSAAVPPPLVFRSAAFLRRRPGDPPSVGFARASARSWASLGRPGRVSSSPLSRSAGASAPSGPARRSPAPRSSGARRSPAPRASPAPRLSAGPSVGSSGPLGRAGRSVAAAVPGPVPSPAAAPSLLVGSPLAPVLPGGAAPPAAPAPPAVPAVPAAPALPRARVLPLIRSLGLLVVRNPGHGDCLAYALSDASYGFFPAFSSRQRAQDFLSNNPAAPAVRALTAAETASLVEDGVDLTDNQARIFSLAFSTDILFLDTPSNLARYVEHGAGEVRYLSDAQCRTMLLDRRLDNFNPLRIIKYTTGHYEGVCWPQ